MTTSLIADVTADLYRDEGVRSKVYKDSRGILTIGVGHNLAARGLCDAAIRAQFDFDLQECMDDLDRKLPWWRDEPDDVKRVLINMGFNLGIQSLLKFSHMLLAIRSKRYPEASKFLLDSHPYVDQVKERATRLAALLSNATA
jgi:lysozyme